MTPISASQAGRGSLVNPPSRFDAQHVEYELNTDSGFVTEDLQPWPTELIADRSRSIIATNDSPDVGFTASLNPYRGCEHGCAYCYARPSHEYLGYSSGLDFETKILYKPEAPELLRRALSAPSWVPRPIAISGVTDAYQPVERKLGLTRRCLQVLAEFRNPVSIITKGALVTRDLDLLAELASHQAVHVWLSITTLDRSLSRKLEPRASLPEQRLRAIEALAGCGIPVGLMAAPVIPGLTDHELPSIVASSAKAGAVFGGALLVRLPGNVATVFLEWLERHFPEKRERVLGRLREMRGGRLSDARFGHRMSGEGPLAEAIFALFRTACRRHGLNLQTRELNTTAFRNPLASTQLSLFK
jgi:DNA repair photolyase